MDEHKSHYTPAQFGAFLKVQLVAGRQKQRGRFRSLAALKGTLPAAYVKHLDFLIAEGDVVLVEDQSVYVDGWDEWQEGDLTVRDRMAKLRNRRRNGTVTETVTATVTGASPNRNRPLQRLSSIGLSVGIEEGASAPSSGARAGDVTTDPADAYWSLTGRYPVGKPLDWIDELIAKFGAEAVTRHLVAAYSEDPKTSTILGRTQNRLRAENRALDRKEAEDEKARLREKRAIPKELPAWEAEYRAAIEARYAT
jgi:hypothetical protein